MVRCRQTVGHAMRPLDQVFCAREYCVVSRFVRATRPIFIVAYVGQESTGIGERRPSVVNCKESIVTFGCFRGDQRTTVVATLSFLSERDDFWPWADSIRREVSVCGQSGLGGWYFLRCEPPPPELSSIVA